MAQEREPDKTIPLGRIEAAIRINRTDAGKVWFNTKLTRRYRDGGESRDATTFGLDDLPVVALAAFMAYAWIWKQKARAHPEQAEE